MEVPGLVHNDTTVNSSTDTCTVRSIPGLNVDLPKNTIKIISLNCQSLQNKIAHFQAFIANENPDIIAGTESNLNHDINSNEVFTPEFNIFRKDRKETGDTRKGGGVFFAVRNNLSCRSFKLSEATKKCEILWVVLSTREGNTYLGNYYRPPASSNPMESIRVRTHLSPC